jgi:hypothetical protein
MKLCWDNTMQGRDCNLYWGHSEKKLIQRQQDPIITLKWIFRNIINLCLSFLWRAVDWNTKLKDILTVGNLTLRLLTWGSLKLNIKWRETFRKFKCGFHCKSVRLWTDSRWYLVSHTILWWCSWSLQFNNTISSTVNMFLLLMIQSVQCSHY